MGWSSAQWCTAELYLPATLSREERRERIEAHVKELLAETDEWPVLIGCPDGGRVVDGETLRWLVEYRKGPSDQETRWRSMPAQHHR